MLAGRVDSPRLRRIEQYSPRNVVHVVRLTSPDKVDEEFAAWIGQACRVGLQEHVRPAQRSYPRAPAQSVE